MIVADASVLIAHLNENDAHHAAAEALLLDVADKPLASSTVTLAEVMVGPARTGRLEQARGVLSALGVQEVALGPGAAARLAQLRAATRLRLPDCCVLLAAQEQSASGILTFDERLTAAAASLGLRTHGCGR